MRHLTISVDCDWCGTRVDEHDAENVELTIGRETRETDLCRSCLAGLEEKSRVRTKRRSRAGRTPALAEPKRPARQRRHSCPECAKTLSSASNLARHRHAAHASPTAAKRKPRPTPGGGPATLSCPYCRDPRSFRAPGLALHIKANHPQAA